MNVLAYDLYPNDTGRAIAEYVALDELYARVDVITLHCNLTPENTGMINKDSIAKMKDGVILINNAITVPVFVTYITRLCTRLNLFSIFVFVVINFFLSTENTICFNQIKV